MAIVDELAVKFSSLLIGHVDHESLFEDFLEDGEDKRRQNSHPEGAREEAAGVEIRHGRVHRLERKPQLERIPEAAKNELAGQVAPVVDPGVDQEQVGD